MKQVPSQLVHVAEKQANEEGMRSRAPLPLLAHRQRIKICSRFFTTFLLCTSFFAGASILQLTDRNYGPSSPLLLLFTSANCRYCQQMQDEYQILSSDEHVCKAGIHVASVEGPANRRLRVRFGVTQYPTLLYLRDGERMYTYRGERIVQHMRSFVLKGYENQGDGLPIPPKVTWRNILGTYWKSASKELSQAANGDFGMIGYATVGLTGLVIGLVCMLAYITLAVALRKVKET
mmetsp:Transcript_4935/g.14005  ORF Transcript_4935/g.14005 Transcript_4935/m.14005 type:complete len:234 (+) Transcript_4935:102-803(+)